MAVNEKLFPDLVRTGYHITSPPVGRLNDLDLLW
jgi:hypothetical protein